MRAFISDLRFAGRMLAKQPGSTLLAVFALTLAIGANTAIFSVVNGVLLRPLQYASPERLAILWETNLSKGIREFYVSPPDYKDWLEQSHSFETIAAFRPHAAILTGGALPERIEAASVAPRLFDLLGAHMILGRGFLPEEDRPGRNGVVVLSYGLWQRRFGADRAILGRPLTLDGANYTVVGVSGPQFRLLDTVSELWIPYTLDSKELKERGFHTLKVIGRLKPDVTIDQARQEMQAIARALERQYADTNTGWSVNPVLVREQLVGDIRPTLFTLLGAVSFVLLIACANVANLLLVRATSRQKEIAIRTALGASHLRIMRQMLTESMLLSLASGVLGLLLAFAGVKALVALNPANMPRIDEITVDVRVLAFTLLVSLLTGLLFGLGPALTSVRANVNEILKAAGRTSMASIRTRRTRSALVVAEIALSVALLAGAGLMIRTFIQLHNVNPGFRPEHVVTMEVALPESRYEGLHVASFYRQLIDRVQSLPGVQAAAVARNVPLSGGDPSLNFIVEHRPVVASADQPRAKYRAISADYFSAMGIPLIKGRYFTPSDGEKSPAVAIINDTLAKRFWPDEDPVGKRIQAGFDGSPWCTIVGVVGNVKHAALDAQTNAEMYYSYLQVPPPLMSFVESSMTIVVRTSGDLPAMARAVRGQVQSLDPDQPIFHIKSMQELLQGSVAQPRLRALLLGVFAAVALILAVIGLYGVISYSVSQRSNEMGVRAALGANQTDLLRLVIGEGARLAFAGVIAGLVLAALLTRTLTKLLFGVTPADPVTFIAIPLLLAGVALLATYIPAVRASRTDPAIALRNE